MNKILHAFIIYLVSCISASSLVFAELEYQTIKEAYYHSYRYEKSENYIDAIKTLQVVYQHYPSAYTVNLRLGYLHLLRGKYSNASQHYLNALKTSESAINPKLGLMQIALLQQKYNDAETLGFKIIKQDMNNYHGNLKLSTALIANKKYENAESIILKILALYPEDISFLEQYAYWHSSQGLYEAASNIYSNILILDPENVNANYYFSLPAAPSSLKKAD